MKRDPWPSVRGPVLCVVGARPNFMKMAPILRALAAHEPSLPSLLVHTGQHYDADMNDKLFVDLKLPSPDINLEVGSGTHAVQTAEVMRRFEPVLDTHRPSCVLVVGDVNSTLACTLVASKKGVPVAHVEAGLRSYDRSMPEEINRVLTDQIADLLYTTERVAHDNLAREGIDASRVHFVGNVMIDSLLANRALAVPPQETLRARQASTSRRSISRRGYGVVTLHRPSNVDDAAALGPLLEVLRDLRRAPAARLRAAPADAGQHRALRPLGARLRRTDRRPAAAGLPRDARASCPTPRWCSPTPAACRRRRRRSAFPASRCARTPSARSRSSRARIRWSGRDRGAIERAFGEIMSGQGKRGRVPELWDGRAAERIAAHLGDWLAHRPALATAVRTASEMMRAPTNVLPGMAMANAMTIDVEDYFQVSALAPYIARSQWDTLDGRVEANVERILAMLDEYDTHATFFTLGWIAERYPGLIRRIVANGHELASHGFAHQRATEQNPAAFFSDIQLAKIVLEDLTGVEVTGYRAPSFSIGPRQSLGVRVHRARRLQVQLQRLSDPARPLRNARCPALRARRARRAARGSGDDDAPLWPQLAGGRRRLFPAACPTRPRAGSCAASITSTGSRPSSTSTPGRSTLRSPGFPESTRRRDFATISTWIEWSDVCASCCSISNGAASTQVMLEAA